REAGNEHPPDDRRDERDRPEQGGAAIEVWPRWTPAIAALAAMGFAVVMRVPFWGTPLTSDEGGYAEVARLWEHSGTLYRDVWVDRPQGLILIFRAILHLGGGSPEVM